MSDVPGCEGAAIDPLSGDLLISLHGTIDVLANRGFERLRLRGSDPPSLAPDPNVR